MAVTSVDVDQDAIREVKRLMNMKTDREVINLGISLLLARARQKEAVKRMAKRAFTPEEIEPKTVSFPL